MIVVVFRRSGPGLKLFCFDIELRHCATLITSRQPRIPLLIKFNRQIIFSQAGLERRHFPFLELTGAWIEAPDVRALKIVVPDHLVGVDCQIVGRASLARYFILGDHNFGVSSAGPRKSFQLVGPGSPVAAQIYGS